ncbi:MULTISPECIES: hypothetical protein [Nocardioides]|uniref:hypothetical protein n=1 Tax=Nocardioides TaxID=1839 RepID=UPI00131F1559|nr:MULTISPECIES: hypothetical protein [Nocardioides]MCR1781390.1 hypothetical protein [Nocardioides carbamazepini]
MTVDQGVVHLDEHGETDVIEPFDAVHLGSRALGEEEHAVDEVDSLAHVTPFRR